MRHAAGAALAPAFERCSRRCSTRSAAAQPALLAGGVAGLIAVSVALPAFGLVVLKMLPFDNKSEFQVVVDMPAGTPLERTPRCCRSSPHLVRCPR
jgi:multidrug efflux pump subunit AcrB